jgi:hypothetical protein
MWTYKHEITRQITFRDSGCTGEMALPHTTEAPAVRAQPAVIQQGCAIPRSRQSARGLSTCSSRAAQYRSSAATWPPLGDRCPAALSRRVSAAPGPLSADERGRRAAGAFAGGSAGCRSCEGWRCQRSGVGGKPCGPRRERVDDTTLTTFASRIASPYFE